MMPESIIAVEEWPILWGADPEDAWEAAGARRSWDAAWTNRADADVSFGQGGSASVAERPAPEDLAIPWGE